jgi:hypothetical protein
MVEPMREFEHSVLPAVSIGSVHIELLHIQMGINVPILAQRSLMPKIKLQCFYPQLFLVEEVPSKSHNMLI